MSRRLQFKVGESRQSSPAYALGQSSFFEKYEKKNLKFFTWSWENDFGNFCPSLIKKIGFPFFKKIDLIFKRQK